MKRFFTLFLVGLIGMMLCAQETAKQKGPDLQMANAGFFDPTKEVKVKESYTFGVEWRLEAGYVQNNQRSQNKTYTAAYLHGGQVGVKVDFLLPLHFSIETGLSYSLAGNIYSQHYPTIDSENQQIERVEHHVLQHHLIIPVRAYYTQCLPKQWRLVFYGGPQLQIGIAEQDNLQLKMSREVENWARQSGMHTEPYNRLDNELNRVNIQLGVGGGVEWNILRLTAGYDFGLNNLVKTQAISNQHMWEWAWHVTLGVRIK